MVEVKFPTFWFAVIGRYWIRVVPFWVFLGAVLVIVRRRFLERRGLA
jgi:hypothetical protein